jgi:hypothetical protein
VTVVAETRLQAAQRRIAEALLWARLTLDEREQRELLDFACRVIAKRVREQIERDLRRAA